jgi:hypothetical protein
MESQNCLRLVLFRSSRATPAYEEWLNVPKIVMPISSSGLGEKITTAGENSRIDRYIALKSGASSVPKNEERKDV